MSEQKGGRRILEVDPDNRIVMLEIERDTLEARVQQLRAEVANAWA